MSVLSREGVYADGILSEHKKDPGIPNNYPFKDQLLAEVAEQRRIVCSPFPLVRNMVY